ncbi:MAG: helix-turn-helix protein [Verrucomicrobiaceae bacterium]|nr:helix-turn-helix protein [Verrucomicrobiaceae bacterium]
MNQTVANQSAATFDWNLWKDLIPDNAVVARQRYRLASVKCDMPLIIFPMQGSKQLYFSGETFACNAGEYLMVHSALDISIENIPSATESYRAWLIAFPWRVVELTRQLIFGAVETNNKNSGRQITCDKLSIKMIAALERYLQLQNGAASASEINLSLINILLALYEEGSTAFLTASDPSLAARMRVMISSNPCKNWLSADFEETFHISGATLRRRLVDENTSLRLLLREARLQVALSLLQTTSKPIKTVAFECGYQSLSSFRENFIEQFGTAPTAVANYE